MITINYFAPILIAWFFTNFSPLQSGITKLYEYIPDKLQFTREYLECFKCVSFWLTLIVTQSFLLAILFSIIAFTYTKVINSFKIYI